MTMTSRLAAAMIAGVCAMPASANDFFTIGTGGVTGVYYPAGGAICRLVNTARDDHGLRCTVEVTDGSIYNINTIRAGELQFGIAQSDWQFHAVQGTAAFEADGPFDDLRSVFSIHPELFTLVARADAGIGAFDDLKGKRVNIGNPGSGQRSTMEVVLAAKGWTLAAFAETFELRSNDQSAALCADQFDAMVYTVGHPSASIFEATATCASVIVPVGGDAIDGLIDNSAHYTAATIPGNLYPGNPDAVPTFGVGATIVTSASVPEDMVYHLVKSVFGNFDAFRKLHPALADLDEQEMISQGLSAPLHAGAERYYRERGWM